MIKHALWILSILAIAAWLGGCGQQAATTQAPAAAAPTAAKPEAAKPEAQPEAAKPEAAKPEAAKPAEQPTVQQATPGAVTVTLPTGMQLKIVYFDFDKYDIKPEFRDAIKYNADTLNKDKNVKVTIEGHCDERGSTEYNLALGERRATAVQKALVSQGVAGNRLKIVSYGEERPVDQGHDEAAWAKNRRGSMSQ
jgi:peptidoglycan-associated lipoprotein